MNEPVYCKNCNSRNSWVRAPELDIKGVMSGITYWHSYKCKVCGFITVCPTEEFNAVKAG